MAKTSPVPPLWFVLLAASVEVRSALPCPSSADVQARLGPLLVPSVLDAGDVAELLTLGPAVVVRLLRADGSIVAEKEISAEFAQHRGCDERAALAAVVLASWEGQLAAEREPAPLAFARPPSLPRASASDERAHWAVASGAWLAADRTGAAPAFSLDAWRAGPTFGVGISALAVGTHATSLPEATGGEVSWQRLLLGAGPLVRWGHGPWNLWLLGQGDVGVLSTAGANLPTNRRVFSLDAGLRASAGAGISVGVLGIWLGAGGLGWLRPQAIGVDGLSGQETLPRGELWLGGGVLWTSDS